MAGARLQIFTSVRFKLTIWYLLVFGSLLVAFSGFIYASISRELQSRVDRSLSDSIETVESVLRDEVVEMHGDVAKAAAEALSEVRLPNQHVSVVLDGNVVAADSPDWQSVRLPAEVLQAASTSQPVITAVKELTPDGARVAAHTVQLGGRDCTLVAAHPMADVEWQLASIRRLLYLALPGALLIAGLGGFLMAKKSLAPVMAMSDQAERIGASNLHERLRVENRSDELGRLATVFNALLARLDDSFKNMRRFMADASHELRTPLSIVRGEAEIALSQDREVAQYREALEIILDEAARLSRIVDDMLELARADAGQRPLNKTRFYVNDVVEESCRSMHVLAAAKGISLALTPSPDIPITADEDLIRRMIVNLLDNAIKYTPSGGSVSVRLIPSAGTQASPGPHASLRAEPLGPDTFVEADTINIEISDTGIGIPVELATHVFRRFYRGYEARSERAGGAGLGLSIARWVAESHGGSIDVTSSEESGSTFRAWLPAGNPRDRFEEVHR